MLGQELGLHQNLILAGEKYFVIVLKSDTETSEMFLPEWVKLSNHP